MEGQLDQCDLRTVSGWAWHPDRPGDRARVEIVDGARVLATLEAAEYRPDLEAAGKGDGRCSFRWMVPSDLLDDAEHTVRVRFAGTDTELATSPRTVTWSQAERGRLAEELRATMRALPWEISEAALEDGRLTIRGFAVPPLDGRPVAFTVNGNRFGAVDPGRPSARIGNLYWYWPGSARCGFEASLPMDEGTLFAGGPAVLQYVDAATGEPFDPGQTVRWPVTVFDRSQVPPAKNIERTSGYSDGHLFLQEGFTAYTRLRDLLAGLHGAWPAGRTLDWGVGCGRVVRWLLAADHPGVEVHGGDIDGDNVALCRATLPGGTYTHLPLMPPTPYPDGHFTAIYGLSVFTHLTEDVQFAWLAELARITAPGGTVLVTVHGDASYCLAQPDAPWLARLRERGIDASIHDACLSGHIDDDSYYRATFHSLDYVRERWSEHFEVVAIHEGFVCHQQDMVVLRKRR